MQKHTGGIIYKKMGASFRILIIEPTNHKHGYVWTFPNGLMQDSERIKDSASRVVNDITGYECTTGFKIGEYTLLDTKTTMFLMTYNFIGDFNSEITKNIRWVTFPDALKYINKTTNLNGKKQDIKILQDAAFTLLNGRR